METNRARNTVLFILLSMFVFGCSKTETNNIHNKSVSESAKEDYYKEKILGTWICDITIFKDPECGGTLKGEINYLRSGKSNFNGKLIVYFPEDPETGTLVFYCMYSATWKIENKYYYETINDCKFVPNFAESNNQEKVRSFCDFVNELMPKGLSYSSEIIKIDDNVLIVQDETTGVIATSVRKVK